MTSVLVGERLNHDVAHAWSFFFQAEDGIRAAHSCVEFRRVLFRSLRWVGRGFAAFALLFILLVGWLAITAPLSKSLSSAERRAGKEGVSTCRSRWPP